VACGGLMAAGDQPRFGTGVGILGRRWLFLVSVASTVALLALSGCGGSGEKSASAHCGEVSDVLAGNFGGSAGGKAYLDVEGKPVVSRAGRGTSCEQLLALAEAYAHEQGDDFLVWLGQHAWIWLNRSAVAGKRSLFDLDQNDVFIGSRPGQRSQVAFHTG
jgi:hypothetical protein